MLLEKEIPEKAVKVLGASRTARINTLVHSLVENSRGGELAMEPRVQEAFDELHAFMYAVSYTHLDVYKRRSWMIMGICGAIPWQIWRFPLWKKPNASMRSPIHIFCGK